jgi:hypothetical protein
MRRLDEMRAFMGDRSCAEAEAERKGDESPAKGVAARDPFADAMD